MSPRLQLDLAADGCQLLSDPYAQSTRQRWLGSLPSPQEPGGPQGVCDTPRGIQTHNPLVGVVAPRQLGGNAFKKTVHLAAADFGISQHRDKLRRGVLAKCVFYASQVEAMVTPNSCILLASS
jgi:hypothetical protein